MSKLIDQQVAIDAVIKESNADGAYGYMDTESIVNLLNDLPSKQQEIILCKNCKLFGEPKCLMCFDGYDWAEPDGYCHMAERRTDG